MNIDEPKDALDALIIRIKHAIDVCSFNDDDVPGLKRALFMLEEFKKEISCD